MNLYMEHLAVLSTIFSVLMLSPSLPPEENLDLEDGQWEEIHVITGALKLFLRELPEPLFPYSFFDKFIAAISKSRPGPNKTF